MSNARGKPAPRVFPTAAEFRAWLEKHAATKSELLVGMHKVGSGIPGMTWPESVDEALCFGWIDAVRGRIDDDSYSIRFTPRRPTSVWSAINIAKFKKLCAEGRMTPAGEQAYARRTAARSVIYSYEQKETAKLSPEETAAFRRNKVAWRFWDATPPGCKKTLIHWVTAAKKIETRERRFARLVDACTKGVRLR